jgi:glycosyltransferase involved in cell wall biosynthesis
VKPGKFPELCDLDPQRIWLEPMQSRTDLRLVPRLVNRIRQQGIELLHAHTPRTAWIASWIARKTGLPWVYHVHSPAARDSTRPLRNRINGWVERIALRHASRLITVSESLRQEWLLSGWNPFRVITIPNGVPEQSPIDPIDRIDRRTWRLGMVALIRPRKGLEVLLRAMHLMKQQGIRGDAVSLEVIGDFESETYRQSILGLTESLGLTRDVHWRGFVKDMPRVMRELDALVLPSLFGEGMPMVVLESLALGIPVIASRVEGTPEVVRDGQEGCLTAPSDPTGLADAIARMTQDRDTWYFYSQRALHRHRTQFTDAQMTHRVAQTYTWALAVQHFQTTPPRWLPSGTTAALPGNC